MPIYFNSNAIKRKSSTTIPPRQKSSIKTKINDFVFLLRFYTLDITAALLVGLIYRA